jgi:hypothetical protein
METEFDRDDAIGHQIRALRDSIPLPLADDGAWRAVERRRARRRARRLAVTGATAIVLAVAVGGALARSGPERGRVRVVQPADDPPVVRVLPTAPNEGVTVSPAGPYAAGQRLEVTMPAAGERDAANAGLRTCFAWAGGELCDPQVAAGGATQRGDAYVWSVAVTGWVHTPRGLEPCDVVRCRLVWHEGSEPRNGTGVLDVAPGPRPGEPARVVAVADDGTVTLEVDGLVPDKSWGPPARAADPALADPPPGSISLCAFGVGCDGIVRPDPPPFDGGRHTVVVATNRLLFTDVGWVDCVAVTCAIAVHRDVGVVRGPQTYASGSEVVAFAPYRLPATTPVMRRPTLTIDRAGPFRAGETVTVTLHDPPAHTDMRGHHVVQCGREDLRAVLDCGFDFPGTDEPWAPSPDGSLQRTWRVTRCGMPTCYLALAPPVKGYPDIARTERFTVG